MSPEQYQIVRVMLSGEWVSTPTIAARLKVSGHPREGKAISSSLAGLCARGTVSRKPDPANGRHYVWRKQ